VVSSCCCCDPQDKALGDATDAIESLGMEGEEALDKAATTATDALKGLGAVSMGNTRMKRGYKLVEAHGDGWVCGLQDVSALGAEGAEGSPSLEDVKTSLVRRAYLGNAGRCDGRILCDP
jgi:hypothetical protein